MVISFIINLLPILTELHSLVFKIRQRSVHPLALILYRLYRPRYRPDAVVRVAVVPHSKVGESLLVICLSPGVDAGVVPLGEGGGGGHVLPVVRLGGLKYYHGYCRRQWRQSSTLLHWPNPIS